MSTCLNRTIFLLVSPLVYEDDAVLEAALLFIYKKVFSFISPDPFSFVVCTNLFSCCMLRPLHQPLFKSANRSDSTSLLTTTIPSSTVATFWNSQIRHQRTDLSDAATCKLGSDLPPASSGERRRRMVVDERVAEERVIEKRKRKVFANEREERCTWELESRE